jgi:hypothetical protein
MPAYDPFEANFNKKPAVFAHNQNYLQMIIRLGIAICIQAVEL